MHAILTVVFPVFAIIAAGYLSGRRGLLGPASSEALNRFVYWVALPAFLFRAMATVDLGVVLNGPFIAGFLGGVVIIWAVAIAVARVVFGCSLPEATLHGMNGVYGNSGYMGIPLALAAFGPAAAVPAIVVVVLNSAVMMGMAIVLIEWGRSDQAGLASVGRHLVRALARNPVLVAPLAGIAWAALGWPLPVPVERFTGLLGAAAGPCALFSIGLFMVGKPLSQGKAEVGAMTLTKLVVHPLVTAVMVFFVFPTDPLWATVAVLIAALPTGTGGFVLAQAYGVYVLRTSSATLVTTVLSVATISLLFLLFPPTF
ncbi:MAG: AEC family transporter [Proteobacteria bacterium]|nr:AEC family transporter [Pseudomonadota bacterium]